MKLKLVNNPKFAGFIPRVIAALIDGAVVSVGLSIIFYLKTTQITIENMLVQTIYFSALSFFLLFFAYPIFIIVSTSRYRKTLGKYILGLEVTDTSGKNISLKYSVFRELFAKVPNNATFGFGYLSILFDQNHQGWHDHLSGTFVHQKSKGRLFLGVIVLLVLHTIGLGFVFAAMPNIIPIVDFFKS